MARQRDVEGRDGSIYHAVVVKGWTEQRAAREFGLTQERVGQILAEARRQRPAIDHEMLRRESIELLDHLRAEAMEIVEMIPAPLLAGKDGVPVVDPETGEYVRDYSGRLQAMEFVRRVNDTVAKRMGLDAPARVEQSGTIKYEITGTNPDDLS